MYSSGFFNGDTEYGQEEFNRYFNKLYESGVSLDDEGRAELPVTARDGAILLGIGLAIVRGFYFYNNSALELPVEPDTNYSRIDRVVLRLNVLTGPVEPIIKKGTAGSTPIAPTLQRDNNTYEISLAKIAINPSGEITVSDERFDNTVCGIIRPRNLTEYKDMVTEFKRQFDTWFEEQQAAGWTNIYNQENEPSEAARGNLWI